MVIVLMEDFGSLILVFGTAYQLDQCLGRARSFRVEHFRTYCFFLRRLGAWVQCKKKFKIFLTERRKYGKINMNYKHFILNCV